MVVQMHPCCRRGGLWWRREVGSGGEWRWDLVEKKTGEGRKECMVENKSGGREKRMGGSRDYKIQ